MKISKLRADTAMRSVAGTEVPRQNTTSVAMRAALKKGGSNYAGESGEVDGEGAKSRLDRPGRKHGGMCHKDGGDVKSEDLTTYKDMDGYEERKSGGHVKKKK